MYHSFAYGYDKIMADTDYHRFADYYERIFRRFSLTPHLILDLGCGAGNITGLMAQKGYDMIGVDRSAEMLDIARQKKENEGVLFLQQDMRSFELYGTVDVIYSALDCMNYITGKTDLKQVFRLCENYLNPGGLLIFDVNTPFYFEQVLHGSTFVYDREDVYLVWQSQLNKKKERCTFYLDLFYREGEGYRRFYEEHEERVYSIDTLSRLVEEAGLCLEGSYHEFRFQKIRENTQRAFFIARRKHEGQYCKSNQ